jgi:Domain of unknown function (DUF4105)
MTLPITTPTMLPRCCLGVLLFCSLLGSYALAAPPDISPQGDLSYLARLQEQAHSLSLSTKPYWHKLVHYERQPLTRRLRSLADDADFFNAGKPGATDPEAELQATLAAFFDPRPYRKGAQAARCRFPARALWLQEQLGMDVNQLPPTECPDYTLWRERLPVRNVTLVFPSAYVNSPASMYGHTFLRLDPARAATDTTEQPLLAYTISYAAAASVQEGMMFAVKGLVGAYPGTLSNGPYYMRLREYVHLENRDIWEYPLTLTPPEINRLQAHTWELAFTTFDYYFFDENCAYLLVNLIDIARPGLDLSAQFTWWTMPVDTVRAVANTPDLVAGKHFRPSNHTELRYLASTLGTAQVDQSLSLSRGRALGAADQDAHILELAERLALLRAARGEFDDAGLAKLRLPLLTARAKLAEVPTLQVPIPTVSPEAGHRTGRWEFAVGAQSGHSHWRLSTRPSYHDVLDPEAGFQRGAQIQFFDVSVGQPAGKKPRIESFIPVDILSLSPASAWQSGASWKVRIGASRAWGLPHREAPLVFDFNGGPGWAFALGTPDTAGATPAIAYAFLDNQLWHDRSRPNQAWQLGSGLQLGLLWDIQPRAKIHLQATYRALIHRASTESAESAESAESGLSLAYRWQIDRDQNTVVRCEQKRRSTQSSAPRCELGWQRYW